MNRLTPSYLLLGALALALALALAACGDDDGAGNPDASDGDQPDGSGSSTIEVTDDISASETWTADKTYILKDHIFVTGGTLTIEAGTLVKGDSASSLVVTAAAKIDAQGTETAPIVFTSNLPEGSRAPGDWGGVVLLGSATINVEGGGESIEGFPAGTTGTEYGGDDDAHDCGTLTYARIEFAGFELAPDNELNALTLGGCGSATEIDYVQTHKGADDGVEVFGGTAVLGHLVITQADDDSLDSDFGWTGGAQFVVIQQNAIVGNMGFEFDSNKDNNDAIPRNAPEIWNVTMIGSGSEPGAAGKTQGAMHLRRGTAAIVSNAIIGHFADFAVNVSDFSSASQAVAGNLEIRSSYFFQNANDVNMGWPTAFDVEETEEDDCETVNTNCLDEADFFSAGALDNTWADPELGAAISLTAPDFAPMAGSPVLVGGATPGSGFDASATFIGAIGDEDWTTGWTAYPAD